MSIVAAPTPTVNPAVAHPAAWLDAQAARFEQLGTDPARLAAAALRDQARAYRSVTFGEHAPISADEFFDRIEVLSDLSERQRREDVEGAYDRGYAMGAAALEFDCIEF